jgi:hypothetical protein
VNRKRKASFRSGEAALAFSGFLFTFLGALAARFQASLRPDSESASSFFILIGFLLVSSICSGIMFRTLRARPEGNMTAFGLGFILVVPMFWCVDRVESVLTRELLLKKREPGDFIELAGHCGVRAGRSILRLYQQVFRTPLQAALYDFELGNRCRLSHYQLLEKESVPLCKQEEHPVECRVRWMNAFSELGYWNYPARKYFYDQVIQEWSESRKEELLLGYALRDQELETRRQNLLRQAGLDESLASWAVLLQQRDELNHLELSIRLFEKVHESLPEQKGLPSPQLLKFKDLFAEIESKRQRLVEIKKSIETLEQGKKPDQL